MSKTLADDVMQARKAEEKFEAINAAHKIAHATGIAGYAIETFDGWVAAERKPSIRFGEVLECHIDGKVVNA